MQSELRESSANTGRGSLTSDRPGEPENVPVFPVLFEVTAELASPGAKRAPVPDEMELICSGLKLKV